MSRWRGLLPLLLAALFVTAAIAAAPSLTPYVASRLYPLPPRQALAVAPTALPPASETPGQPAPPEAAAQTATALPAAVGLSADEVLAPPRIPTRIVIPAAGVDAVVVPVRWEMKRIDGVEQPVWSIPPAHQAGWHEGSAPLGQPGNTVINGHNWPQEAVFRDLYRIEPGDVMTLYAGSTAFVYQVAEVLLLPEANQPLAVRQENARYIAPTADERVTLVTCHPYGSLAYRLIVIARPVPPRPRDRMEGLD
jgi:LPXTG-site transpeptidase (sortase) family protein